MTSRPGGPSLQLRCRLGIFYLLWKRSRRQDVA